MIKLILFSFFINQISFSFVQSDGSHEYNIICQEENESCAQLHRVIKECGIHIFTIWLNLDLLYSVQLKQKNYEDFYSHINKKIDSLYDLLVEIKNCDTIKNHRKDIDKIAFYLKNLKNHQIIKYTEEILKNISRCSSILE